MQYSGLFSEMLLYAIKYHQETTRLLNNYHKNNYISTVKCKLYCCNGIYRYINNEEHYTQNYNNSFLLLETLLKNTFIILKDLTTLI